MSAFLVGNDTINRIVASMTRCKTMTEEQRAKFGLRLLKMNCEAIRQRYTDSDKLTADRLKEYVYEPVALPPAQTLKSFMCFLYQCSEGNVPDCRLYKEVEKATYKLAIDVAQASPDFRNAKWE